MEFFSPAVIAALVVVLAIVMVAGLYIRNYIKVPPNEVAVFTGRGETQLVRGGAKFKIPGIHRVDMMSLAPFPVEVRIEGAYSKNNVPVKVDAVALIRFGTEDTVLRTAIERFLTSNRDEMQRQAQEILAGNLRGVIANMTIEELNSNREQLAGAVIEEAKGSFGKIGMELEVLTIQNIADADGYLHALGRTRIAEVKRDADIGEAEAARDAAIRSAAARQEGETAQAQSETAIAEANRERDLRLAAIQGEVEAEAAKAAQAGPLAEALAAKDVGIAEEQARAAREAAAVDVETRRAERARAAQQADVIAPAEARRQAADLDAEAARVLTVTRAEADAEATRQRGAAEAESRTALSQATEAELVAAAEGRRAQLVADADGERASLLARAEGEKEMAEALNGFSPTAVQLYLLPRLIDSVPQIAGAVAAPIGNVDRIVLIGSGGAEGGENGASGVLQQVATMVPLLIAQTREVMKATTGLDIDSIPGIGDLLGGEDETTPVVVVTATDTTPHNADGDAMLTE
jgi:flotillin